MDLEFIFVDAISDLDRQQWDHLAAGCGPFLDYDFLHTLEHTDCVAQHHGWQPCHLAVYSGGVLIAAMPLYQKTHSYGEYVFDFAWAEAYQRHGLHYYPKLVSAIPFTPVTGPRLLCDKTLTSQLWPSVIKQIKQHCLQRELSSAHLLFTDTDTNTHLVEQKWLHRTSVQFHWFNRGYQCFEDFTDTFSSRKRKNLNKERARLEQAGIRYQHLVGEEICKQDMLNFYRCYQQTYLKRSGHNGYLTPAFFEALRQKMAGNLLLIQATQNNKLLASALLLFDSQSLYGRYWGALEPVDGLHFEVCYYQGIEFCIKNALQHFNPGTQGEHKIQRGFEPVYCYSGHWLARPEFHQAVADFLQQEAVHIRSYKEQAESLLPFRQS
ncbi:GNAT family N-acetyltransferase [Lacimicrobium alkaliphilum]|uniref:GNAT family N-acetyltransferase n=1 Tax=Lacimicrobium alkaliphilum TaxID=1526571 RepID=A0ABQ1RHH0_9ALTE|nr:GNAT family N-acetyltransferase [Lacimicrobium alkaliphilum]GGD66647.1 hypothetical protein GCM10011357_22370 [Lacimicrobium alkaliphilum]